MYDISHLSIPRLKQTLLGRFGYVEFSKCFRVYCVRHFSYQNKQVFIKKNIRYKIRTRKFPTTVLIGVLVWLRIIDNMILCPQIEDCKRITVTEASVIFG